MDLPLPAGKLPVDLLATLLADLPPPGNEVLLGPAVGEDACAVEVPAGILVAATDPITFTSTEIGRLAVIVNANDVAVMGSRPRWFLATLLLPEGSDRVVIASIFGGLQATLDELGASLVGGHTEMTTAVVRPVVVGQMLGMVEGGRLITTGGARPGDVLIQVGPAPVEGAAVLAAEAGAGIAHLPAEVVREARRALDEPGISVVEPALAAARLGATAMHDPTEGGLSSGLHELAVASGVGLVIDREAIVWFDPGVVICEALGADPWATIASGTLLVACRSDAGPQLLAALGEAGYRASAIGAVVEGEGVIDRSGRPIPHPLRDEVARVLG